MTEIHKRGKAIRAARADAECADLPGGVSE
jgi:hypothetical protein